MSERRRTLLLSLADRAFDSKEAADSSMRQAFHWLVRPPGCSAGSASLEWRFRFEFFEGEDGFPMPDPVGGHRSSPAPHPRSPSCGRSRRVWVARSPVPWATDLVLERLVFPSTRRATRGAPVYSHDKSYQLHQPHTACRSSAAG